MYVFDISKITDVTILVWLGDTFIDEQFGFQQDDCLLPVFLSSYANLTRCSIALAFYSSMA